jgi:hypothetical protein
MNSDFSENDAALLQLERELKSLTPLAPSRAFMQRLTLVMDPASVPTATVSAQPANRVIGFPWKRVVTPAAAAAAAVAVMSITQQRRGNAHAAGGGPAADDEAAPTIKWTPMPMKKEYRQLVDNGYFVDENNVLRHNMSVNAVEHHEWRNSDGNSIRLIIPSQERILLPAAVEDEGFRQLRYQ